MYMDSNNPEEAGKSKARAGAKGMKAVCWKTTAHRGLINTQEFASSHTHSIRLLRTARKDPTRSGWGPLLWLHKVYGTSAIVLHRGLKWSAMIQFRIPRSFYPFLPPKPHLSVFRPFPDSVLLQSFHLLLIGPGVVSDPNPASPSRTVPALTPASFSLPPSRTLPPLTTIGLLLPSLPLPYPSAIPGLCFLRFLRFRYLYVIASGAPILFYAHSISFRALSSPAPPYQERHGHAC